MDYTSNTEFKSAVVNYAKKADEADEAFIPVKAFVLSYWTSRELYFTKTVEVKILNKNNLFTTVI